MQHTYIFTACFCFFAFCTHGQHIKSFDFSVQTEATYRILSSRDRVAITERNQVDVPGLGYRVGFNFNLFSYDSRKSFRTGLNYSNSGYSSPNNDFPKEDRAWNAFEVPIAVRFYAGERACATFVDLGLGLHYRMHPDIHRNSERAMVSANAGFGFAYAFSKKYGLHGQLPFRYALTGLKTGQNIRENWISAGFELGLRWYFE